MDTNIAMRLRALRLVRFGLNQKVVAGRMGISESRFSRWLRGQSGPVSVTALDGLDGLVRELSAEALFDVTKLSTSEQTKLELEIGIPKSEHAITRRLKKSTRKSAMKKG